MSWDSIQALLEKHAPKRTNQLPDARAIRLAVAKQHLHQRRRLPPYVVKTIKAEYDLQGSLRGAAKVLGCNHSNVGRILLKRGLTRPKRVQPKIVHGGRKFCFDGRYYICRRRKEDLPALSLHRVLWEERNGPVPYGMKLVFVTPNYHDMSDANLKPLAAPHYSHHILSFRKDRRKAA